MSKAKSKQLIKSLVKECLIEILAEGMVGNRQATLSEASQLKSEIQSHNRNVFVEQQLHEKTQKSSSTPSQKRNSYLDNITMGVDNHVAQEKESIKQSISHLTNDPIMADIFADTAMTTLREQKEGSRPSGPAVAMQGDQAAKTVDAALPDELFGGASEKWASLAFAPSIRK